MSDSDDSETAAWEREQMLRGTQSRRQNIQQQQVREEKSASVGTVNAALAKKYVYQDIEKEQAKVESIKRAIGSTRVEIMRHEKRIDAIKKHIEQLESNNNLFQELSLLDNPTDVINFLEQNKSVIAKLPHDQKEMITLLDAKMRGIQSPMDTGQ